MGSENEVGESSDQERGHNGLRRFIYLPMWWSELLVVSAHLFHWGQTTGFSFLNPNPAYQSPLLSSNRNASILRTASLDRQDASDV